MGEHERERGRLKSYFARVRRALDGRPRVERVELRNDDLVGIVNDLHVVASLERTGAITNDVPAWELHVRVETLDVPEFELRRRGFLDSPGMKTGDADFDGRVVLSSSEPGVLRRFGRAATRELALRVAGDGGARVEQGHLHAWVDQPEKPSRAARFIELAAAFRAALSIDPWRGLADRAYIQVEPDCFRGAGGEVALIKGPKTRVILRGDFPMTSLRSDAAKLKGRVDTRNPVVDRLVQVAGIERDILPRLEDEEFVGALLELVHGNEGSTLYPTRLSLVRPGVVEDAVALLGEAEDFARRLSR